MQRARMKYPVIIVLTLLLSLSSQGNSQSVLISEFLASNGSSQTGDSALVDEDGDSADWIELYNPTAQAVDLGGWYLTDDADDPTQWQFPAGLVLESQEILLVFASGKDRLGPHLHTNFKLSAEGEYIGLIGPDGQAVAHEYAPQYPGQLPDVSYGLAEYGVKLVHPGTALSYHVPGAPDASLDWTSLDFNDTQWRHAQSSIGFSQPLTLSGRNIGNPGVAGFYAVNGEFHVLSANGIGLDARADAFHFAYVPLQGDGELSTRVISVSQQPESVRGGIMLREKLTPDAKFVAQILAPAQETALQWRHSTAAPSALAWGESLPTPLWFRMVRQGSEIFSYHSSDGVHWTLQQSQTVAMAHDAYIGLFLTAGSEGASCSGIFDQITLGSTASGDLQPRMFDVTTSLWARAEFGITHAVPLESLYLSLRYEDAFVAYLNGVEIARDNVSGSPAWHAGADSDRPNDLGRDAVTYDVSAHAHLLRQGRNVLAIHALNDRIADQSFHVSTQLTAKSNRPIAQYFSTATPGRPNSAGARGVVAKPQFSVERGFHDAPFELEITSATGDAVVRYTTDGSAPSTVSGQTYTGPIPVTTTTCVRAIATRAGWLSSDVDTHSYIFLDDVLHQPTDPPGFPAAWESELYEYSYAADYGMDPAIVNNTRYASRIKDDLKSLPSLSLVMHRADLFDPDSGIYSNTNLNHPGGVAWERPGSVELIHPDGTQGFRIDCGVRVVGGWGAKPEYRKHSFRLLFKRDYGPPKLRYALFGPDAADEFDTLTLRANFNDCYVAGGSNSQYIRDEFCRRLQMALGQRAGLGTFVHLYVNGLYWGLYNPVERPDAAFAATYFGGDKEDWNAYNSGRTTGESTSESWNGLMSASAQAIQGIEAYQRIQGNDPDGQANPDYIQWLDMENYIDYLIMNFYVGNRDWPGHNWYAAFNKVNPTGFKCFSWDAEHVMGLNSNLDTNQTGVSNSLCRPYARLRANSEFRLLFGDRVHRAFSPGGPCYVDPLRPQWDPQHPERNRPAALYAELAHWIEGGIVGESARWGDVRGGRHDLDDWKQRRDWILNTYMRQRSGIVLDQLRQAGLYPSVDAPQVYVNAESRYGGYVSRGDSLWMLASAGEIYYTLDGSDPRRPIVPHIVRSLTVVPENASKRALVPSANIGNAWRTEVKYDDSHWLAGPKARGVGYERGSGYEPYIGIDVMDEMNNQNTSCYVRIPFVVDPSQLPDLNFMMLKMRYDDGFVAYINGVEVARANASGTPQWNGSASGGHSDATAVNFEDFEITAHVASLRAGDNLLAIHGLNTSLGSSDFLIAAQLLGLVVRRDDPDDMLSVSAIKFSDPIPVTKSTHIKARALKGGTWSALAEAFLGVDAIPRDLRITEIMYHPPDPNTEYIELANLGSDPINLDRVRFVNGIDFVFGDLDLAPQGLILVVRDQAAFQSEYPPVPESQIAGQYGGSLSDGGERIELQDALGQTIHSFRYRDTWYDDTDGAGLSLLVKDPAAAEPNGLSDAADWRASAQIGGTPGREDNGL